ncbi:carboxypeptidase regulatory-like domain-containing protein [Micromonospora peucetia]|uniref:carboxypeptidase regulatory-like domain-containing protein n=1 Tax=Micromonospora peucetia TaxID=47871 RepID=UPI002254BB5A|nr:carboxypeptidase regulatory-like domain-containing protein [Micromonospora peucetia]MCX4390863.1 carboxypeptidase regulatory-like domain-containing protein [Micromonospora peucetia]
MALRSKLAHVLIVAMVWGALGVPDVAAAAPSSASTDGRVSLRDGIPAGQQATAAIGTRTGPAAALVGEKPQRPKVAPEVTEAAADGNGRVGVIIRLRDQVNLSTVAHQARDAVAASGEAESRGRTVVKALQAKAATTQGGVRNLLARAGATRVRPYWVFNGFSASVPASALEQLAASPEVESVALDEQYTLPETTPGAPRLPTWGLEKVRATDVWADHGFTGEGVVVGIMDGGVDGGHPALAGSYRGRDGDHAHSWFAATGENYPTPADGGGHGTHVAGTIVGAPPGDVTGVAPGAEWIAVKIFNDAGRASTSGIHAGFEWMLAPGGDPSKAPDVVNNSWGSDDTYATEFWEDVNAWVAAGIFPNFAAGNNGPGPLTVGSPASFPQTFAVGATDINDQIASFSSRGSATWDGVAHVKPQVSAPGQDIYSTWPRALDPDGYHTISGTSMATPHVTGVIALLLSAKPGLSVDAIRELLTSTARTEPHMGRLPNNDYGVGIADARAAVVAARFSGTVSGTIRGPQGPLGATVSISELGVSTTADPVTGFYDLRVKAGTWTVRFADYGSVPRESRVTVTADGQHKLDVTLAAAAVHDVSGTVRAADGPPLADAEIRFGGTPVAPVYTGPDGRFAARIAAGTYPVSAQLTGYARQSAEKTISGGTTIDFSLTPLNVDSAPEWREYQNNPRRTGQSAEPLTPEALTRRWQVDLPGGQAVFSSPVLAGERIFLVTEDGQLHSRAVSNGVELWRFRGGGAMRGTPAVAGGKVYVGGGDDQVFYALDAGTGAPVWTYPTGDRLTYTTPTVVGDTVYFGTGWGEGNGGWVYALDAQTGALRWRSFIGGQIYFAPTVANGTVFAGSFDARRLVALDAATGAEKWALTRTADSFAAMPTHADGVLYVGTSNFDTGAGSLLAVDASTGAVRWEASGHGDASGSAPNVHGDLVIAGSHSRSAVAAYDRTSGARRWITGAGSAVSSAMVLADGVVIGGSQLDRRAWALDAYTGKLRWEATVSDNVLAAPAFADGKLVVAARNGQLSMFEAPGTITGTVTGPDGARLAATARIGQTGASSQTDPATGVFTLPHRAGSWRLDVSAYGYAATSRNVAVRPGRTVTADTTLQPIGTGSLAGTVRDESGVPLAGVTVALTGTPVPTTVTDDSGRYEFGAVAAGTYELRVTRNGYAPFQKSVAVAPGERTVADATVQRYQIAVTGDYQGILTGLLTAKGYRVEATTVAAIADRAGDYRLVVANGANDDPGAEVFKRFLANADTAGTSVIFLDTWAGAYGSLTHLSQYTGDPQTVGTGYDKGEVSVIARAGHPLTTGLPVGAQTALLDKNREYAWFAGYGGRSVADLHVGTLEVAGSTIGYQPRTPDSVHVLLSANGVSPWAGPGNGWQPAAYTVFDNAVSYALGATFGTAAGRVTDANGAPLSATVTVAGDKATTAADGSYSVLLPAGEHTLRVEAPGFTTREVTVRVTERGTVTTDLSLLTSGSGTVTGVVRSGDTPVAGATVTVAGVDRSATSAADGRFTISDVPGGTYSLRATATGYVPASVAGTVVVDGQVTTTDVELTRSTRVAVVGDARDAVAAELTTFLNANHLTATATGWEAVDQLDRYDVVVFNTPSNPGRAAFLAALGKLDAAGVSGVFIEGATSAASGAGLLRTHLGNPTGRSFESTDGYPMLYPTDATHPVFAGVSTPLRIMVADEWAGYYTGHTGFNLADFGTSTSGVLGGGVSYEPRTATSVRLLLSGLSASSLASPSNGWSVDGKRVFLNAVGWAAAPRLAGYDAEITGVDGQGVAGLSARIVETNTAAQVSDTGRISLAHPAGTYTLEVKAFGYQTHTRQVTLTAGKVEDVQIALTSGEVGTITGTVTDRQTGAALAGATVQLDGAPRTTVTGPDGRFSLTEVEAGRYAVRVSAAGHVRQVFPDVVVTKGAGTALALGLRPSPKVAVLGDHEGRAKAHLAGWGYQAADLAWTDVSAVGNYDLVLANLAANSGTDPGAAGWAAFEDAIVRADVPVVWLDQYGRGAIKYLTRYDGDPQVRAEDRLDGPTQAKVLADHPLTAGFPAGSTVPLTADNAEYSYFTGFSGVTVANLVTGAQGERGGTIGYRGRSAGSVDVLLSTMSISTYGYPATADQPAKNWTTQTELLFHNALRYALDAPPLAATVRGTVRSSATGEPTASTVTVVETGATATVRAGDGSYALPLQPGTWTLRVGTFGHQDVERSVTVVAGDTPTVDITLPVAASGTIEGTVRTAEGAPVAGAAVTVEGTPLSGATGADGTYRIAGVPTGSHSLRIHAEGYGIAQRPVTVQSEQRVVVDVELAAARVLAVAGDSAKGEIAALLSADGYLVRNWNWADIHLHVPELGKVEAVVLNGQSPSPTAAELNAFLTAAAEAEVSVIMAGQWGSGAVRAARTARNDPSGVTDGFTDDGMAITYTPSAPHPIFAGFEVGKPIPLMRNPQGNAQQWQWFSGYSGETIASIGEENTGALGGGVGVKFTSPSSVEVLLAGLASGSYGRPGDRWTPEAVRIYLNAVKWALDASQGGLVGTVTGDGAPLAGAEVRVVEAGLTTRTGADGTFRLGMPGGTYTVQVSALGFVRHEATVTVKTGETLTLPVAMVPVPRGSISGTVTDTDGTAIAGARLVASGPTAGEAITDADGRYTLAGLIPGDYQLVVDAKHHLTGSAKATVVADQAATVAVRLKPTDVAVLGDVGGALTGFLRGEGVAAEANDWSGTLTRLPAYRVVVVNGGDPTEQEFDALVSAADAAEVSLVFTGTWGAANGGIRLLERYGDGAVTVGGQGYRNGPVGLVGFDRKHPVFAGIADPAAIVAPDGYWSDLASYSGTYLANLSVGGAEGNSGKGVAVAYDFRTARSMHLLVSVGAVSTLMGPGHGWTEDTGRLVRNAVAWAGDAVQAVPARPVLTAPVTKVSAETVTLTGSAEFRSTVDIRRNGVPVGTAVTGRDGRYAVEVPLRPGANRFTAVATNHAGASASSRQVTVIRYTGRFTFAGLNGNGTTVAFVEFLDGTRGPVRVDDGVTLVLRDTNGAVVREQPMEWDRRGERYTTRLTKLPKGEYTVQVRATVDGWPIPLDGGKITRG